jgi:hypothetical protein
MYLFDENDYQPNINDKKELCLFVFQQSSAFILNLETRKFCLYFGVHHIFQELDYENKASVFGYIEKIEDVEDYLENNDMVTFGYYHSIIKDDKKVSFYHIKETTHTRPRGLKNRDLIFEECDKEKEYAETFEFIKPESFFYVEYDVEWVNGKYYASDYMTSEVITKATTVKQAQIDIDNFIQYQKSIPLEPQHYKDKYNIEIKSKTMNYGQSVPLYSYEILLPDGASIEGIGARNVFDNEEEAIHKACYKVYQRLRDEENL